MIHFVDDSGTEKTRTKFPVFQFLVPLTSFQMLRSHDGIISSIHNSSLFISGFVIKFDWASAVCTVLCWTVSGVKREPLHPHAPPQSWVSGKGRERA